MLKVTFGFIIALIVVTVALIVLGFGKIYDLVPLPLFFVSIIVYISLIILNILMIIGTIKEILAKLAEIKNSLADKLAPLKTKFDAILMKLGKVPKSIWKMLLKFLK